MKKLILVDKNDKILGSEEKLKCHLGKGILHRAFSIFIFNDKGELLIQKRSKEKMLWPGYWANSACTHHYRGEKSIKTGERRVKEELGFSCPLKYLTKFYYYAKYGKIGSEREIDYILTGTYNGKIKPNKKEVMDCKWISLANLKSDIKKNPKKYTPWFKLAVKKFF